MMGLRWKLFAGIACAVTAPVAAVTAYFPAAHISALEDALLRKAVSFARMSELDVRPAIAFDDAETAGEEFASTATDEDVALLALYRSDGSLIARRGSGDLAPPAATPSPIVTRAAGRVRVVVPVVATEGPRGTLVVELSAARVRAEGARWRRTGLLVGAAALLFGFGIAWMIGSSFGRRIGRVTEHARRVEAGDLSERPIADRSRDEIGQLAGVFHTMVRTIERIVAERTEALRASREQLRGLVETTHAVPWRMRPGALRFTYVGPQAAEVIAGVSGDWLAEDFWPARVSPDDAAAVRRVLDEATADRGSREAEFCLRRDDGRPAWIRLLVSHGRDGAEDVFRGFMFDVTERRRLEIELRLAQRLQAVGRLAAGVAHELNTPLQFVGDSLYFVRDSVAELGGLIEKYRALVGLAGVAEDTPAGAAARDLAGLESRIDLAYLLENLPDAIGRALEGVDRVGAIVASMKELAHPDQKDMAPVDVNRLIESTLVVSRNEYKYVAEVATELGDLPLVECHRGDVAQAFLAIVVNAAQAIGDVVAGTSGRGRITVRSAREGDSIVIRVADTGGGIPEAIRDKVFDPFFTTRGPGQGTGQGLAAARAIVVEKHGGDLGFETEAGRGTEFRIRLPIAHAQPLRARAKDAILDGEAGEPVAGDGDPPAGERGVEGGDGLAVA